jgi:mRNA deadenylase 3'-5' endonuclease subunit Ccr4
MICDGCDQEVDLEDVKDYWVKLLRRKGEILVHYCDSCAMYAELNYNGEIEYIHERLEFV